MVHLEGLWAAFWAPAGLLGQTLYRLGLLCEVFGHHLVLLWSPLAARGPPGGGLSGLFSLSFRPS